MRNILTILVLLTAELSAQVQFKRTGTLPSGIIAETFGRPVCYDTDHNGLKEIIYATGSGYPDDPLRWEIWEYRPLNRFKLVYADTGCYPPGPGITSGNFRPFDAGDIDRDGLTDLVGINEDWIQPNSWFNKVLATYESPTDTSYPKSLSWSFEWGTNPAEPGPPYLRENLDGDTDCELVCDLTDDTINLGIWENTGDNQNELVWHSLTTHGFSAFGDFDGDGRQEFVAASGPVFVMKCTGDNQYELVYADTTGLANGYDVFSGDVNGDGNPEFFVGFWTYPTQTFTLYM
jgi:hypothetical protein